MRDFLTGKEGFEILNYYLAYESTKKYAELPK